MNIAQDNSVQYGWTQILKGILYAVIGVVIFLVDNSFGNIFGRLTGGLLLLAGICQFLFSIRNRKDNRSYTWGLLQAILDLSFGIAFLAAPLDKQSFMDTLGYWAITYAFLHAVQAIYTSLTPLQKGVRNYSGQLLESINVLISGALAFMVLSFDDVPPWIGVLPIALGILVILLVRQVNAETNP